MADLGNTAVISPTDASNGTGTMPSWLGSAAPSTLDDAGRALQGAVAREWENRSYPTATGTSPAYVVTYTVAPAAYRSGQTYTFTAHSAATGTDTLNANTLGAKAIKKVVAGTKTATAANDFYAGDKISCVYDGTDMVWDNKGHQDAVSGSITASGYTQTTARLLGRTTASTGAIEEITVGAGLTLTTGTLSAGAGVPSGVISMFGGSAAPTGYLLCDGSAVSRTTYADLFTAISTNYGVGNGSTTFNVPDMKSRIPVGYGTGAVTETQAAANFNVSDVITVDSNVMGVKPKWLTGMPVIVTTSGVLPTGIAAATTYYVRRLSATTISLYTSLATAMETSSTTGRVNITATGSGNHTLTTTLQARALGDLFGAELTADVPSHLHSQTNTGASGNQSGGGSNASTTAGSTGSTGDVDGVTNMPPSVVVNFIIKT